MRDDLRIVWLITSRELRDQMRDWRILFPLLVLTLAFPFIMKEVATQAVGFFARYGTTLIAYRLVPFSVLIIGFFPITISLVVALESFVGEKERGTIEPLLNAPIKNWHLYVGKLLVGVMTPLIASYLAIGLYLWMVSRQNLQLPSPYTLWLLLTLTTAHAVLMVSAAMVISVQSTSVRAANLLASFIVIPVAILMQGESVLLFWGTDRVLWTAVFAVVIMSGLLVRLGLAHFNREYLLGREFDTLNASWVWKTFWAAFGGHSASLLTWYRVHVAGVLRRQAVALAVIALLALLTYNLSYWWTLANVPRLLPSANSQDLATLLRGARQSAGVVPVDLHLSPVGILLNNLRATTLVFVGGLFSLSVLGVMAYLLNVTLVGGVLAVFKLAGYSPGLLFAAGLLPHGVLEIPALMIVSAAVLRMGASLVTPQTGRSLGQVILELIADCVTVLLGVALPLLVLAALVEVYVTPSILMSVLR